MADKAKNLRKTLSKNRLAKQQSNSENQPKNDPPQNPFINPPVKSVDSIRSVKHGAPWLPTVNALSRG